MSRSRPHRGWESDAARALTHVTGVSDPVAAMIACADGLLDEAGVAGPPTPLPILASFQGIRDIERVAMKPSGRLIPRAGGHLIQVNKADSVPRQNFTIAHEIAHTFFPSYQALPRAIEDSQTGDYPQDNEEEHLCDVGAGALLLPERWLRPAALSLPPSLASLERVARQFRASLEATARAVARLDLWPFALVFWEPGWRKADRPLAEAGQPIPAALRVTRAVVAPSFGLYIPRNKSIPEESSVYRAYVEKSATSGLDQLTIGDVTANIRAESTYIPTTGRVVQPRVVSFLLRDDPAEALGQAGD